MIGSVDEQNKAGKMHPVVHGNRLPMWIYDRRTLRFLEVSDGAIDLYGYTREEFLAMTIRDIGPVEDLTKLGHIDPMSVNDRHRWTHRRKDGTPITIAIHSNALIYEGQLAGLVVAHDLSETVSAERVSAGEQVVFKEEIVELRKGSADREMQHVLPSKLAGYRAQKVGHYKPQEANRNSDHNVHNKSPESHLAPKLGHTSESLRAPAKGLEPHGKLSRGPASGDGRGAGLIEENDLLDFLQDSEDWTKDLLHRELLERRAEEAMEHADRTRQRVAVVCLDVDNMAEVFERFGAEGANDCVEQVGLALHRRLRGMDTVARTGMKEFTIILAELEDDFALHRVAAALLKILSSPITVQGYAFALSASIGVAAYPDDGFDLQRLCRAADTAMEQARASGGRRITIFSLEVRQRTELDAYMRETMKSGGFRLFYQPQYSPSGEISTLEALLRLPGRENGFISPDLFIPIAEDSGMIEQLGMWVIEQASRQVKAWHREYGRLAHVAVNVSPQQLSGADFAERALSMIRSHGVVPASIEFEITERAVLNFDDVCEPMRILSEAGIVFAVDDFGTGYSSLQHLHRLPISVLKIDRSFVQRMGVQRMGVPEGVEAIIEAIVSMAHSLGMRVVAEGVETQAQRSAATEIGCDSIQGFWHTPAVDASKIPRLMGWLN